MVTDSLVSELATLLSQPQHDLSPQPQASSAPAKEKTAHSSVFEPGTASPPPPLVSEIQEAPSLEVTGSCTINPLKVVLRSVNKFDEERSVNLEFGIESTHVRITDSQISVAINNLDLRVNNVCAFHSLRTQNTNFKLQRIHTCDVKALELFF